MATSSTSGGYGYVGTYTTDNTNGSWWPRNETIDIGSPSIVVGGYATDPKEVARIIDDVLDKGERKNMRKLYQVYVVDPEDDSILIRELLVAKDKEAAKMKVVNKVVFPRDIEDYDFIVVALGDVRAKKEVKEVRVVGD